MASRGDAPSDTLTEINTNGFCVVRRFCNADEASQMEQLYRQQFVQHDKNYTIKRSIFPSEVLQRLHELLPQLSEATSCQFTDLDPTFAYATKQPDADLNLGWHCDSGSFYDFGSHDTFLNFYVIVQKSDPMRSNLSFVSWEKLRELDPTLPSKLKGYGSVNFNECAGQFLMDDTFGDTARVLPKHFDEIATTPHLDVGDLLIFGVDVPHRTQDNHTARIAFTAKAHNKTRRLAFLASAAYLKHCLQPSSEMLRMSANKYGPWLFARKHFARVAHGVSSNVMPPIPLGAIRNVFVGALSGLLISVQLIMASLFLARRFAVVASVKGWDRIMLWRMCSASAVSLASAGLLTVGVATLVRAVRCYAQR